MNFTQRTLMFLAVIAIAFFALPAEKLSAAATPNISELTTKLPLAFEENRGQTNGEVKFLSRGPGYTVFLTSTDAVLVMHGKNGAANQAVLRMKLVGARPSQVTGVDELSGRSNYLLGNDPSHWQTNVPNYSEVRYSNIYPGVDLLYYGNQRQLEYDLVVAPGARPEAIRLDIEGAERLRLLAGGDLEMRTAAGEIRLAKPMIYQETGGIRQSVSGSFVLKGKHQVGFRLAAYDSSRPLVIDPALVYSTFLGGTGSDAGLALAVDGAGSVYVTGYTESPNFPNLSAFQTTLSGGATSVVSRDAFVTKFDPTGSKLVYSTFIGGSGQDQANAIAIDRFGSAYIAGVTGSSNFPTTAIAFKPVFIGPVDAFVTKLSSDGTSLVYSTFLGGSDADQANGIALDSTGNAYVTGRTDSPDFPTTAGAYQVSSLGGADAFITELNTAGTGLIFSTLLGGEDLDQAFAIALDAGQNIYVTGSTRSISFPLVNPAKNSPVAGLEVFVAKLNSTGSQLLYSTYLGGSGSDQGNAIAVDSTGSAYVAGFTSSADFPTVSPFQSAIGGSFANAFITKLNPTGNTLVYSTYLGGSNGSNATGIAVDSAGDAYITGNAGAGFPTSNPIQPRMGGTLPNAIIAKLAPAGNTLLYSTYLGGSGNDQGFGIVLDGNGNAFITGMTSSADFPATPGTFQSTYKGATDSFVAKISDISNPPPVITSISPTAFLAGGSSFSLTVIGTNFSSNSVVQWNGGARATTFVNSTQLTATILASDVASSGTASVTVFTAGAGTSNSVAFTVSPAAPPVINSISPSSVAVNAPGFTMTVTGSNFVSSSVVQWNGSARTTTFVSGTQLSATIPASDLTTAGSNSISVSNATVGGGTSNTVTFTVLSAMPVVNPNGTVNGASFAPGAGVSPGGIASTFGQNFSAQSASAISVQLNGITAPVFASGPKQVNFQVPVELSGVSQASLVVTVNGISSAPTTVALTPYSPGIFSTDNSGTGQGAILISNSATLAAPTGAFSGSRPANRGEFITIYCTGLGAVTNQPGTGVKAGTSPLSSTTTVPVVTIGGLPATVAFSGLSPNFFGLYQVDVQVPQSLSPGNAVPVVLNIGGAASNSVTIAVQ